MKISELRTKDFPQLQLALSEANDKHFKNLLGVRTRQSKETHLLASGRRDIARIKTIIHEKLLTMANAQKS